MFQSKQIIRFRKQLLAWYQHAQRDLPWRRTRDPYAIWVSEIMLQQTRVTAAIPYYERFLARFPDAASLADAAEADLLAHWAGLGYYYRARNLQKAAQQIARLGKFPRTYEGIRELPGVGDYTAAAVASIAFDLPHAVLDGNVFRVLSRVANDQTDISSTAGKKHFAVLAQNLLDPDHAGDFNQAVMELGAMMCLPNNPQCLVCPVADLCQARAEGTQNLLPVKSKRMKSVEIERTLFWIERDDCVLLWQRPAGARLMPGFWELPEQEHLPDVEGGEDLGSFRHTITFHNYVFQVRRIDPPKKIGACQWVDKEMLLTLPLSTIVKKAMRTIEKRKGHLQTLAASL